MNEIAIQGIGAITPAGTAWPGLFPAGPLETAPVPSLRRPEVAFPALRVGDPALQRWSREPRLRRASPITLLMAEAASQALRGSSPAPGRLAIVGAFFTGPCRYSRLFFEPVLRQGPSFASPAYFPETVYNSSLSHVASLLGVNGACYALVGDDTAWISALRVASVWLDLDAADAVLVVAGEELDSVTLEAYAAAGWVRDGFVASEGAAALLLTRPQADSALTVADLSPGIPYRSRSAARRAVAENFRAMTGAPFLATGAGTWMAELEGTAAAGASRVDLPPAGLGHAFTATAGWNTLRALDWLRRQPADASLWVPVWGLDSQVSALRLHAKGGRPLAVFEPPE